MCVKNLGVIFGRHLTWDTHDSDVVRKCIGLLIGLPPPEALPPAAARAADYSTGGPRDLACQILFISVRQWIGRQRC